MRTRFADLSPPVPPTIVEYAYYIAVVYSMLSEAFGLSVPLFGGGLILALSTFCILKFRSHAKVIYSPIVLLLACATSFLVIQLIVHGESVTEEIRPFLIWLLGLIIVQTLGLRRGFVHRFASVLFIIGLITLPYLDFSNVEVDRARIDIAGAGLGNPNGLGAWFGFCSIYFAILGLQSQRLMVTAGAWLAATGCATIVGLTVGRGNIFAVAVAMTVAFRRHLRRAFVPLLLLIIVIGVLYVSGLLDRITSAYLERGMEESGRELIWPEVIDRIVASPLIGVGISDVLTAPYGMWPLPPHNTFLYFALSSGVVPFALFLAFWIQALWRSVTDTNKMNESTFRVPFLLYTLVVIMLGDYDFMTHWALLAVSVGAGPAISYRGIRLRVRRNIRKRHTGQAFGASSGITRSSIRG